MCRHAASARHVSHKHHMCDLFKPLCCHGLSWYVCRILSKHTSPGLPPRLGRGFALSSLSADDADYYRDRLAGVIRYLGHHKPWLLKVRQHNPGDQSHMLLSQSGQPLRRSTLKPPACCYSFNRHSQHCTELHMLLVWQLLPSEALAAAHVPLLFQEVTVALY
jgi:hypothetical protein